jgi:TatA/E family protein of Tat protein translocase
MLGTLGTPEMIFIFLLALVLFGPKKLPELGRTVGKAITEFRKASAELKTTFDRELKNLEAETQLKEVSNEIHYDTYNYDNSSYETNHEDSYASDTYDSPAALPPPTESASAPQDAESTLAIAAPEGAIARGSDIDIPALPGPDEESSETHAPAEHNA